MKKRIITGILAGLFISAFAIAADTTDTTTYLADTVSSQLVMSSVDYLVTPGDIYYLVLQGTGYEVAVDSSYKIRIGNLGVLNVKGMTFKDLKSQIETLINRNYPSTAVQFNLKKPSVFTIGLKGEITQSLELTVSALDRLNEVIEPYLTSYSSVRDIIITSKEGTVNHYDLFHLKRNGDFTQNPYLRPGDTITVLKYSRKIRVSGAVKRPGTYELKDGEQLQDLINEYADGYTLYANKKDITLRRFTGGSGIYSVSYLTESDYVSDIELFDDDRIVIGSIQNTRPVFYVEGAVSLGGMYGSENPDAKISAQGQGIVTSPASISRIKMNYNDGETYSSFIRSNRNMFNNSSDLANAYILRRSEETDDIESISIDITKIVYTTGYYDNLLIQPEDILVIPYIQYYVYVNGAVASAGRYSYQPDRDWKYYVNLANGFNLDMNSFRTVKIYDKNGKRISAKSTIPPEATITARRDKPDKSWIYSLLSSLFLVIQSCFTIFLYFKIGGTNGMY